MEVRYKEEVAVGAMVIIGLIVFTMGMFWLTGRSIVSKGVAVQVVFKNVMGLKEGDPVRISGVKKGQVDHVELAGVGKVTVRVRLDPDVAPHRDATATVASADFLGAKFVDYNPGSADSALLGPGKPISGLAEEQLADVAVRAASSANQLIEGVNKGLNPGELAQDIHNTLIATQRGMNALTQVAKGPTVDQAKTTLQAVERVMARLDTVLGASGAANTGRHLDTLTTNLAQLTGQLSAATSSLNDVLGKMNRGDGTLGKMATDTMLYKNLSATLASLTALLDDLKERPGRYLTVKVF
jgi:phospholipid/cholesterol/gamma-HCH transport system substrate-binding protein